MNALIKLLYHTKSTRFHPIYYVEDPVLENQKKSVIVYKSHGYHQEGFDTRIEALMKCKEIRRILLEGEYNVIMEVEEEILWREGKPPHDKQVRFKVTTQDQLEEVQYINAGVQYILQVNLRKNHNCVVLVHFLTEINKWTWSRRYQGKVESSYPTKEEFDSYEEALQHGLNTAFQILEKKAS
jgi:hypothetical protein